MKWIGQYIIDDAGQCLWHEGMRIQDEPMKAAYRKKQCTAIFADWLWK
jgi:hypothetical protein